MDHFLQDSEGLRFFSPSCSFRILTKIDLNSFVDERDALLVGGSFGIVTPISHFMKNKVS